MLQDRHCELKRRMQGSAREQQGPPRAATLTSMGGRSASSWSATEAAALSLPP